LLRAPIGLLLSNENQPSIVHFAPSANVTLPKLHEEDRTIVVAAPMYGGNFLLTRVNSKGLADDLLDIGQSLFGKKASCGNGPRRAALRGGMRSLPMPPDHAFAPTMC